MNKKAIYFDGDGKPHDAFIINDNPDGTKNLIYHPKSLRRFWNYPADAEQYKKWTLARNIVHKDDAEKIIETVQLPNGQTQDDIKGIKNCYKVIE